MGPRGLNPGYSGREDLGAAAAGLPAAPVSAFGGKGGTFKSNSDELSTLSTSIRTVITDVNNLATAVDKLTGSLSKASTAGSKAFGGAGGGGSRNTVAPVSAFGGGGKAIGLAAVGEVGASWAGQINTRMSNINASAMPVQLMSSQTAGIFGGNTRNTVSGFTGISNMSASDLGQAMALLQQNPWLYASPSSRNGRNLKGFLNASQSLNPLQGATGAMQFANSLTSNQAQWFMQTRGFASTGGGLFNAKSGGINNANTTFRTVLEALTGNKNLTSASAKAISQDPRAWARVQQNATAGLGLSTAQVTELRQYASTGMNLGAAEQAQSGTVASTTLGRTTAGTNTQMDVFQATTNLQNFVNKAVTSLQTFAGGVVTAVPGVVSLGAASALAAKTLLSIGVLGAEGMVVKSGLGGLPFGGGGKGGKGGLKSGLGIGLAGNAAGIGLNVAGSHVGGTGGQVLSKTGNVLSGAATGAMIGAMIPGIDATGISEVVGGVIGGALGFLGDPVTGSQTTSGMQPNLSKGINAMMAANPNIRISSGHRTSTQQAALYALKGGRNVARPGHSPHEAGKAADIGPPSQFGWIAANASRYGLYAPARNEPWHMQAMGDPTTGVTGSQIVSAANTYIGTPYSWGGSSTKPNPTAPLNIGSYSSQGVDCSRFVQDVYSSFGITLPRTSQAQAGVGQAVKNIQAAQPGDLLFYNYEGPNSHVAIYIGGGKQIAAPDTGQRVQVQNVDSGHLDAIRRVVGGGAGAAAAQAATSAAGAGSTSGTAAAKGAAASSGGLASNFISTVGSNNFWSGGSGGGGVSVSGAASASSSSGTAGANTTGNTSLVSGGSASNITGPSDFSKAVLAGLGISATVADVTSMNAWQQAEGQWGASGVYNAAKMHNPLNTKLPEKGSASIGGGATVSYPNWATGIEATVATIKQGNMSQILGALQASSNLGSFSSALEATPWASSAYNGRSFPQPSGMYAVGDPMSAVFTPSSHSTAMGGSSGFSGGGYGRRPVMININVGPVQTQSDANNIVNMLTTALRQSDEIDVVATS